MKFRNWKSYVAGVLAASLLLTVSPFGGIVSAERERVQDEVQRFRVEMQEKLSVTEKQRILALTPTGLEDPDTFLKVNILLDSPAESDGASLEEVEATQEDFKDALEGHFKAQNFSSSWTYLLNGFSCEVPARNYLRLKAFPGLRSVTIESIIRPAMANALKATDVGKIWKNEKNPNLDYTGEGMVVAVLDSGFDPTHPAFVKSPPSQTIKHLDYTKLAKDVVFKKGGISFNAKDFSDKVPFRLDMSGYNKKTKTYTFDLDTVNSGSDHGMHVSGIVLADDDNPAVAKRGGKGVVPKAQLVFLKVFPDGAGKGASNTVVTDGLELASRMKDTNNQPFVDAINLSLGSVGGVDTALDPEIAAIRQIKEKVPSITVFASAGNSDMATSAKPVNRPDNRIPINEWGGVETGLIGSPGISDAAVTVAAADLGKSDNIPEGRYAKDTYEMKLISAEKAAVYSKNYKNAYDSDKYPFADLEGETLSYMYVYSNGDGQSPYCRYSNRLNACAYVGDGQADKYSNVPADYSTYAFVDFPRNGTEAQFVNLLDIAVEKKAYGVILFGQDRLPPDYIKTVAKKRGTINVYWVFGPYEEQQLKKGAENHSKLALSWERQDIVSPEVATFSSYGPGPDLRLKPNILAPGVNIYSTIGKNKKLDDKFDRGYGYMQGTSMAAPFAAGVGALIKGAWKKAGFNPGIPMNKALLYTLSNTATPVSSAATIPLEGHGYYTTPRRQGAGFINAKHAYDNRVFLRTEEGQPMVSLKQLKRSPKTFTVKLTNYGKQTAQYRIDCGTVLYEKKGKRYSYDEPLPGATLTSTADSISLAKGETKSLSFTLDTSNTGSEEGFTEGFVRLISDNPQIPSLGFPYMGYLGNWEQDPVLEEDNKDYGQISMVDAKDVDRIEDLSDKYEDYDAFPKKVGELAGSFYYDLGGMNRKEAEQRPYLFLPLMRSVEWIELDLIQNSKRPINFSEEKTTEVRGTADTVVTGITERQLIKKMTAKSRPVNAAISNSQLNDWIWRRTAEGKLEFDSENPYPHFYNTETDEMTQGQFFYRAKIKPVMQDEPAFYVYVPYIVDFTEPVLGDYKAVELSDGRVEVSFTTKDLLDKKSVAEGRVGSANSTDSEKYGVGITRVVYSDSAGQHEVDLSTVQNPLPQFDSKKPLVKKGTFKVTISRADFDKGITAFSQDYFGNYGYANISKKTVKLETKPEAEVTFNGQELNKWYNTKNITLTGSFRNLEALTVGDQSATLNKQNNTFSVSLSGIATLKDGENELSYTGTPADGAEAGSTASGKIKVKIDTVNPDIQLTAPEEKTNENLTLEVDKGKKLTITGKATDLTSGLKTLKLDSKKLSHNEGAFSTKLGVGTHTLMAEDKAGNSRTLTITIKEREPVKVVFDSVDGYHKGTTVTLTGSVSGAAVLVVNGQEAQISEGKFTVEVSTDTAETGTHNFEWKAYRTTEDEEAEKPAQTGSFPVKFDNTPPTLAAPAILKYAPENKTVKITIQASDAESGLASVTVNDQPATLSGNNYEYTLKNPSAGVVLNIVAKDNVGNTESTTTTLQALGEIQVIFDQSLIEGKYYKGKTVTLTGTIENGQVLVFGESTEATIKNGSFTVTLTAPSETTGKVPFSWKAYRDAAAKEANLPGKEGKVEVAFDNKAPEIALTSDSTMKYDFETDELTITGTVKDADSGYGHLLVNETETEVELSNGAFSITVTPAQAESGNFKIQAVDKVGNVSEAVTVKVVENAPIEVAFNEDLTKWYNKDSMELTGTITNGNKLVVGGVDAAVNDNGSFTVSLSNLPDGENDISWQAYRASNHQNVAKTGSIELKIDRAAPSLSLTKPQSVTEDSVKLAVESGDSLSIEGKLSDALSGPSTVSIDQDATVQYTSGGTFSATLQAGKTYTITGTDVAGNKTTMTVQVYKRTTLTLGEGITDTMLLNAQSKGVSENQFTVTGTVSGPVQKLKWSYQVAGAEKQTREIPANQLTNQSFSLKVPLEDKKTTTVTLELVNAEDQKVDVTRTLQLRYDTTAPALSIEGGVLKGDIIYTKDKPLELTITTDDDAKKVTLNGDELSNPTTGTGTKVYRKKVDPTQVNKVTVVVEDQAGNTSELIRQVKYDNAGPNVIFDNPAIKDGAKLTVETLPALQLTVNDGEGIGVKTVALNGGTNLYSGTGAPATISLTPRFGKNTIVATDELGNTTTITFTLQAEEMTVTFTTDLTKWYNVQPVALEGSYSQATSITIQNSADPAVLDSQKKTFTVSVNNLAQGVNRLIWTASRQLQGQTSPEQKTGTIEVRFDAVAPVLTRTSAEELAYYEDSDTVTLAGTVTEPSTDSGLDKWTINGQEIKVEVKNGVFKLSTTVRKLKELQGSAEALELKVSDKAGNLSTGLSFKLKKAFHPVVITLNEKLAKQLANKEFKKIGPKDSRKLLEESGRFGEMGTVEGPASKVNAYVYPQPEPSTPKGPYALTLVEKDGKKFFTGADLELLDGKQRIELRPVHSYDGEEAEEPQTQWKSLTLDFDQTAEAPTFKPDLDNTVFYAGDQIEVVKAEPGKLEIKVNGKPVKGTTLTIPPLKDKTKAETLTIEVTFTDSVGNVTTVTKNVTVHPDVAAGAVLVEDENKQPETNYTVDKIQEKDAQSQKLRPIKLQPDEKLIFRISDNLELGEDKLPAGVKLSENGKEPIAEKEKRELKWIQVNAYKKVGDTETQIHEISAEVQTALFSEQVKKAKSVKVFVYNEPAAGEAEGKLVPCETHVNRSTGSLSFRAPHFSFFVIRFDAKREGGGEGGEGGGTGGEGGGWTGGGWTGGDWTGGDWTIPYRPGVEVPDYTSGEPQPSAEQKSEADAVPKTGEREAPLAVPAAIFLAAMALFIWMKRRGSTEQ